MLPTSPAPVAVRPAEPRDVEPLLNLIDGLSRHHGDECRHSAATLAEDLFGPAPWMAVLVAERDGVLVGYAGLIRLYRAHFAERGLDLHHLFVRKGQRGGGIGQALVEATVAEARGQRCTFVTVGTHPDNHEAQAFYRSCGFELRPPYGPKFKLTVS